ncbi:uncharacterized protein PHALS_08300 [Plasmopara halstedii]|uniref:Uncharacterized protein n=1 Tax=Plasmopara halstedii TaxID=4781 RepID=A0A0P1ACR6_PLAHL|nr:uncharacterized protein PHALS_08300 [Plasmopara halstedii]CEG38213.1 hypothetical protein PHALS_08300 [Plasmopara halstedii]|eukprot:XP_024574582.1 hypothetical protein PHALS_08300 [Plasmopara halstedii]
MARRAPDHFALYADNDLIKKLSHKVPQALSFTEENVNSALHLSSARIARSTPVFEG